MTDTTTVTRTYLRMDRPEQLRPARAVPDAAAARLAPCTAARYRELYAAVGAPWHWHDRDAWSDERLAAHLADPSVSIFLFTVGGSAVGYFELQRHDDADVEIAYFGLFPDEIGKGYGGAMLTVAVGEAWTMGATSVWLHTCTLDHPRAIENYRARGFAEYRQETYEVPR
ncbi:MAG TPA: GNAT family N-acetyltransferase [Gemmatimonadaceae bacterium]|nr:GNAT family N-acetyltransferase [Gemmatimonadaceae bacterium]